MGAMHIGAAGSIRLLIITAAAAAVVTGCQSSSSSTPPAPAATTSAASGTSAAGTSSAAAAAAATAAAPAAAGAGAGGAVNVCSLLTSAQASAINKVTYGAATPKHLENGWDECSYANNGSVDPVDIQHLDVDVLSIAGCYDQLKSTLEPGTAISGVGDAAFGYEIGLLVRTGSTCVQIQGLTHAELMGDHSGDVAIAKIVLAGLH
jgi:hypothetical protein